MARRRALKNLFRDPPQVDGLSRGTTLILAVRIFQYAMMSPWEFSLHESIERAVRIHDLLYAAKRWHEDPLPYLFEEDP